MSDNNELSEKMQEALARERKAGFAAVERLQTKLGASEAQVKMLTEAIGDIKISLCLNNMQEVYQTVDEALAALQEHTPAVGKAEK